MSEQNDTPMGRIMGKWPGDFDDSPPVAPSFQSVAKVRIVSEEFYAEHERLRDLLRWRKWPEEKPNESGWFLCNFGRTDDCEDIVAVHFDLEGDRFDWSYEINPKWWRPIGPLPCERGGE